MSDITNDTDAELYAESKIKPCNSNGQNGERDGKDYKIRKVLRASPPSVTGLSFSSNQSPLIPLKLFDLYDNAIAAILFSGFLDSLFLIKCLRLVCKKLRNLASVTGKILDLHCTNLSISDLSNMINAFPNSEEIDLSFCKCLGSSFAEALSPCRNTLKTLILRGVGVTNLVIENLIKFELLQVLDISQRSKESSVAIDEEHIQLLGSLSGVRSLNLAWNANITDKTIVHLATKLPHLQVFNLSLLSKLTSESATAISKLTNLKCLSLRNCSLLGDSDIVKILKCCKQVTVPLQNNNYNPQWLSANMSSFV